MARANKKQALGRGLGAGKSILLKSINNLSESVGKIIEIPLNQIKTNPSQPRTHFEEKSLQELANSIKILGIIQPITVRKENNAYQIISGERRFRASQMLEKETIPAYIRIANDQELLEMALVENLQRENLDPIEIALSYKRLLEEVQLTQEQLSKRVGKSRPNITNHLRLLKLEPIIQTGIRDGFITMGHGRALIGLEDSEMQLKIYKNIVKNGLSVRATEILIQKIKAPKKNIPLEKPLFLENKASNFEEFFKVKNVTIKANLKGKGVVNIPFESEEDFKRILDLLE